MSTRPTPLCLSSRIDDGHRILYFLFEYPISHLPQPGVLHMVLRDNSKQRRCQVVMNQQLHTPTLDLDCVPWFNATQFPRWFPW